MRTIVMALAVSCTVLAVPAAAQDMRVEYADLNLSSKEGRKALDRRIDAAARQYCNYDGIVTGSRLRSRDATRCYREAKSEAKKQVAAIVAEERLGG